MLRKACGNARTVGSQAAHAYLKHKVSPQGTEERTYSQWHRDLQDPLDDAAYQQDEVLRLAKGGGDAKALHRANLGDNKTIKATDEDRERRLASQEHAAQSSSFRTTSATEAAGTHLDQTLDVMEEHIDQRLLERDPEARFLLLRGFVHRLLHHLHVGVCRQRLLLRLLARRQPLPNYCDAAAYCRPP